MNKVELKAEYKCGICGEEYLSIPSWGYCDETLDCACDDGESLIKL